RSGEELRLRGGSRLGDRARAPAPVSCVAGRLGGHRQLRLTMGELDGIWTLRRLSGALPPLGRVRKRISGGSGETLILHGRGSRRAVTGAAAGRRAATSARVRGSSRSRDSRGAARD